MRILPSTRQLTYLIALHQYQHFTNAAKACFITQSALSTAIAELESLLEVPLIDRSSRKVIFTPIGEELVKKARKILTLEEEMMDLAQILSAPLSGIIKLGVIPTLAPWIVPPALAKIYKNFPHSKIHLKEMTSQQLMQELNQAQIDVGLLALPWDTEDHHVEIIAEEDMVIACGHNHPWASKKVISLNDIEKHPMIMLEDSHCLKAHALSACINQKRPKEDLQATSIATLLQMVAFQPSATLLPRMAMSNPLSDLSYIEFEDYRPLRKIALLWRKSSVREPDWFKISQLLKDVAKDVIK